MRESLVGIALLLCTGCVQIPQWDTIERATSETELENATTQLEMNSAMGAIATLAEKHMLVALEYKLSKLLTRSKITGVSPDPADSARPICCM